MDPNLETRISNIEARLEAIYTSVEKTRKYIMWTMIGSIAFIIIPLIAMAFVIPALLSNLSGLVGI